MMRGLTCAVFATFVGGLLSCSEHSQASHTSAFRRPQSSQERVERVRWPQQAYGSVSAPQRAWRRGADPEDDEPSLARAWAREYDDEAASWEQQTEESEARHRHVPNNKYRGSESRYHPQEAHLEEEDEEEEDDVATAGSHVVPDKMGKFTKKNVRHGGGYGGKRHHYSTEGGLQLAPKSISVVCSVKDPLEHIIWLRTPCPEEYERGEVIARGSVSLVPDVFAVSVSGEDGGFTSTLTILKPRDIIGSGVFRCEAWPHFSEHRRHRSLGNDTDIESELEEEPVTGNHTRTRRHIRVKRSPHDPWNAIILGGSEMIEECFYGSYGDKWRKYRALNTGRTSDGNENNINIQEKLNPDASNQKAYQNYQYETQASAQNYPQYEKIHVVPVNYQQSPKPESTSQSTYQPHPTQATYPSTAYQSEFGKFVQEPSSYQIQAPQPSSQSYYQSQSSQTQQNYQSQPSSYHSDPSQFYHQSPSSPTTTEQSAQTYQTSSKPTLTLSQLKQLYSFYSEVQKVKKLQAMQNAEERHDQPDQSYYNRGGLDIHTNMRQKFEDADNGQQDSRVNSGLNNFRGNLRRGAEDSHTGNEEYDSSSNSGLHLRTNMRRGSEVNRQAESRVINVIFPHTQE